MGEPANGGGEFGFVSSKNSVRGERETAVLKRWKGFGDVAVAVLHMSTVVNQRMLNCCFHEAAGWGIERSEIIHPAASTSGQ